MSAHGKKEVINEENCNKCHTSETGKLIGTFHLSLEKRKQPGVFVLVILYQILLWAFVLGGIMFFATLLGNKRAGRGEG
jgi:hypothetical protein